MKKKIINYGRQHISQKDISFVKNVFKSELITQGNYVDLFEKKLSKYFGSKYSCAVSNGTSALHLAIKSLRLKNSHSIITSPITFISTASSIIMNNHKPILADIDHKTYTLDPNIVEQKIKKDKSIKAIIGVDYAGHPCDWEAFKFLKNKYGVYLINDNCHAMGSKYLGKKNYACKYADIVTQSYHPVKNFTTGEGGSVLTNNKKIFDFIKNQRSHNMVKDASTNKKGIWYYKVKEIGYNYRITDFQCALGISQLKQLDKFVSKRVKIAKYYNELFSASEIFKIPEYNLKEIYHSFHLYPLLINFKKIPRINFFNKMLKLGVRLQVHYIPLYKQPFLKKIDIKEKFPVSENFYSREVSMPIYFNLSKKDQFSIYKKVENLLNL